MKINYSIKQIKDRLEKKYNCEIKLSSLKEGMESQVYSFKIKNKEYIIRINSNIEGFLKNEYVYNNYKKIPIPKIIETGIFNENDYYSISNKISGITFEDADENTVKKW